tara:strand:+ start:1460 stop:1696 length:237 start_codon:yes stop_codon:yes gene_type:complete
MEKCKFKFEAYCIKGLFSGKPTEDDCLSCSEYKGKSRGLGDDVTQVIKKTKLNRLIKKKPCKCGERRKALNKAFPRKD